MPLEICSLRLSPIIKEIAAYLRNLFKNGYLTNLYSRRVLLFLFTLFIVSAKYWSFSGLHF